jgi:formylglycine-generating enzyme required for sulfatase activity
MYCKAQPSKRLCGKIGGGANSFSDYKDATKSQWFAACSSGGKHSYPYGDTFNPAACNGPTASGTWKVAYSAMCQTTEAGFAGVFDLSGNAFEWEDSCDGQGYCRARGGGWHNSNQSHMRCDSDAQNFNLVQIDNTGFRCCSDP